MIPLSVLDLAPIVAGGDAARALRESGRLASHVEGLGYERLWLAEHHNMPGVASAATAVAIGYVASQTQTLVVGAGGIMLPNHAPLIIAEQFGTLASLYPGRVELGLGRAPGTDPTTAQALRRDLVSGSESFPRDVVELMQYFGASTGPVRAYPGHGLHVPVWILGSSAYGAALAARLGLPYAFASHFAPGHLAEASALYRREFRASAVLDRPRLMLGINAVVADTDDEAKRLLSSLQQAFLALRRGRPTPLPPPDPSLASSLSPVERAMLEQVLSCSVVGSPETVRKQLASWIERTQPDEIIANSMIFDPDARRHSYTLLAEVRDSLRSL